MEIGNRLQRWRPALAPRVWGLERFGDKLEKVLHKCVAPWVLGGATKGRGGGARHAHVT